MSICEETDSLSSDVVVDSSQSNDNEGIDSCDNEGNDRSSLLEMVELLPRVSDILSKTGLNNVICSFLKQVDSGTFPLDNTAFMLWTEGVRWYECGNTTHMH
jgi:hypothetical protein